MESQLKFCIKCDIEKNISEFYLKRNVCRQCCSERYKKLHPRHTTKWNIDKIKMLFVLSRCILLEVEYISPKKSMKYICECGNISYISFDSFKNGSRCKKCAVKRRKDKLKYNYKFVKNFFKTENCKLLEPKYINNKTKMKYFCHCGRIATIAFQDFKKGVRCAFCKADKKRGKLHHRWNPDRKMIALIDTIHKKSHNAIKRIYNLTGKKKNTKIENLLGYTTKELKAHLSSFKTWKKLEKNIWHLDHIFPIKAFIDYEIYDIKLINCLENLQPLSPTDNLKKSDKYDSVEFKKWLFTKGIEI